MKKLTITIDKLGKTKVEADGFNGQGCMAAAKPVLDALTSSDRNLSVEEKPEMHVCLEESEFETLGV